MYDKEFMSELLKNQWLSYTKLREIQDERFKKIVKHAAKSVHFYRELYARIDVDKLGLDLIEKLPIVTKDQLRDTVIGMRISNNADYRDHKLSETGGTTGEPLVIYQTSHDYLLNQTLRFFPYILHGWDGGKFLLICSNPTNFDQPKQQLSSYLNNSELVAKFDTIKPKTVAGYPSALRKLAIYAKHKPSLIFTGAELFDIGTKRLVDQKFDVDVKAFYATTEGHTTNAWMCEKGKYHLNMEGSVVEVVKNGKSVYNEIGTIVLTPFFAFAHPIIRYDTGDIGRLSHGCECGREMPVLEVFGRWKDIIKVQGKEILPLDLLNYLDGFCNNIEDFQIVNSNGLVVSVVPTVDFSSSDKEKFVSRLKSIVGEFEFKLVEKLPYGGSGKIHRVVGG